VKKEKELWRLKKDKEPEPLHGFLHFQRSKKEESRCALRRRKRQQRIRRVGSLSSRPSRAA
jgi:hypothetical protein